MSTSELNLQETAVLTATEKATKALTGLVKGLDLVAFTEAVESINEEVAVKSNKLIALDAEYADKLRRHKIDLGFKIEENGNAEFAKMVSARNVVAVPANELEALKNAATANENALNDAVSAATENATTSANLAANAKAAQVEANHKVTIAETDAEVTTLKNQIVFLQKGLENAEATITAERNARITIESNKSQPVINIEQKK